MGPQLVRCGKVLVLASLLPHSCSFNGAATCSLRKALVAFIIRMEQTPFNGAATCSLRKAPDIVRGRCGCHSFNGAATCSLRKDNATRKVQRRYYAFNGAATCSLRKAGQNHNHGRSGDQPSMGPQLVRCGKPVSMPIFGTGRQFSQDCRSLHMVSRQYTIASHTRHACLI